MNKRILLAPMVVGAALSISACAQNYAVEGALAGAAAGAGVGAVTDADVGTSAAIGAAAGAAGGALIRKDGRCYQRDRYGREYEVRCR
jgi:osmotically inducible lipoprotein OsmB